MFKQFQLKSVKENTTSVTILTEKSLYSSWMDTLTRFAGLPENKGPNGNKFTTTDLLKGHPVKIYLTMYRTGKLLIQAEKNQHSINLHFIETHLEKLFYKVYSQKSIQAQPNRPKTPVTKPVKTAGRITLKISKCGQCNFQATDNGKLRKHIRKEHSAHVPKIKPLVSTPLATYNYQT